MKLLSFVALIFSASFSFSQDTLYTVSGQKIPAKVLEITQTEIKYKKAINLDGPIYVVDKTDIALIEYKNGSKELYGTGSGDNNQQVVTNDNTYDQPQTSRPRVNIILGGMWGWAGGYNNWGWGNYRSYPMMRHYRNHYYSHHSHHYRYGRRGR